MVEIVIVLLILGILAGVAAPRLFDTSANAQASAVLTSVRTIFDAAERVRLANGLWPTNTEDFEFPIEFEGYLQSSLFLNNSPIAGPFNWNGPGTRVGHIGVSISFASGTDAQSQSVYTKLESLADNGDDETGWIRSSGQHIFFVLAPLP